MTPLDTEKLCGEGSVTGFPAGPQANGPSAVTAVDQVLQDEDPVTRELAEITNNVIKEITHMLTSSIFKQSFRRLFNCMYIKKLKPLYNCDWSSRQSDGEALPYEAHEDFLTKSSRFTGAQGCTSEEGTRSSPS